MIVSTGLRLAAERAFLAALDGSCDTPIAGLAAIDGEVLHLSGEILRPDGSEVLSDEVTGPVNAGSELGRELARVLLQRAGADFPDPVTVNFGYFDAKASDLDRRSDLVCVCLRKMDQQRLDHSTIAFEHGWVRTYASGITLPGFSIPLGSRADFTVRITSIATAFFRRRIDGSFASPIPCSAEKLPPSDFVTDSTNSRIASMSAGFA